MKILKKIIKGIHKLFTDNLTENMKKFIKANSHHWSENRTNPKIDEYVLVEGFLSTPTYLFQSGRLAKSIEKEENITPLVLIDNYYSKLTSQGQLYESFAINDFIFIRRGFWNLFNLFYALINTAKSFFKLKKGDDLLKLKYKDVIIGDLIYDKIIRSSDGVFTINKLEIKHIKYLLKTYILFQIYEKILKDKTIKYLIVSHKTYIESGLLARLADSFNVNVILVKPNQIKSYANLSIFENRFTPSPIKYKEFLINKKDISKETDKYLEKRFDGKVNQHDVINAFQNKSIYTRKDIKNELNVDNNNPFVFILCHVFSDDPHGSKSYIFKDYYTWFVKTIDIIEKIENVNWIIKPHPSAYMYNEEGKVEEIIKKNNNYDKNIYLCPEDLNTSSIKEIADTIVTVEGTAGLEFSCFGIPTIICAKGSYSRFGFTYEPENKKEYRDLLNNIQKLNKLNEDKIRKAKTILNYILIYDIYNDHLLPKKPLLPGYTKKEKDNLFLELSNNIKNVGREKMFLDKKYWKE